MGLFCGGGIGKASVWVSSPFCLIFCFCEDDEANEQTIAINRRTTRMFFKKLVPVNYIASYITQPWVFSLKKKEIKSKMKPRKAKRLKKREERKDVHQSFLLSFILFTCKP